MTTRNLQFVEAVATLVGTIVGAGVLGLPYVVAQAGLLPGLFILIAIGIAVMAVNLFFGEVILRTKAELQMTGYAKKYLGNWGKIAMGFSFIIGIYGALIAYIIGEGKILSALLGGRALYWSICFWALAAVLVYVGLKIIKTFELVMMAVIVIVIILITLFSASYISLDNLKAVDLSKIFLPYGVILFAYLGASSIRHVRDILKGQEERLKNAIIISSLIPMILYGLFALVIVGVTGKNTTEVGTIGLGQVVGKEMIFFGNIFALLAMGTSFLTLGLALRNSYIFDFKRHILTSWTLTVFVPLIIFLAGVTSFIKTLSYVGALVGGIEGVLLILMYFKSKKIGDRKPEYSLPTNRLLGGILIFMFAAGIIYTLLN